MGWNRIALAISDVLGTIVIVRLLALRLQHVYKVFCLFVAYELFSSCIVFMEAIFGRFDYRITYIILRLFAWVLLLWMVYALVEAILTSVPGILKFSRRLLNWTFCLAVVLSLASARIDFASAHAGDASTIALLIQSSLVLERVISTVALLVLVAMLGFILWFPVQIPRNLLLFSTGYLLYFGVKTAAVLAPILLKDPDQVRYMGTVSMFALAVCYAYWAISLRREGELVPVRIGHRWHLREQERVLHQLEAMNAALLRGARR